MQNGLGGSTPPLNCEEKKLYIFEHDKKNIKVKTVCMGGVYQELGGAKHPQGRSKVLIFMMYM